MTAKSYLSISPEVKAALAAGKPVVALESTIITHGMPYPQNLSMAQNVEKVIRDNGAVPATIAIMDGRFAVGLTSEDLERLALEGGKAAKASRRDVAALLVTGGLAGTTVATTMQIAALAGIQVFATGGIGGVHRGAEETFDISADLEELSRTPVAVVCAGAKSILDIAKTLEVLETNGVPVLGYGTDQFPAFWARESGQKVDHRFDDVKDIAKVVALQTELGMGGVLVANPIPARDALEASAIEARIAEAIKGAEAENVSRKDLTPFLLKRIFELTEGKSLAANIALVENNAAVAAQIAVQLDPPQKTPVPCGVPKTGYLSEEMARVVAHNIVSSIDHEPLVSLPAGSIDAKCVLDAGNNGIIMTSDHFLEPREHAWLIPGPEAHWAKLAFERYFLSTHRHGHV